MANVDEGTEAKKLTGHTKKVKNLEEVDFILSQDESQEENKFDANKDRITLKTPSNFVEIKEVLTPKATLGMSNELQQTPRRSCRKSIKPSQDYDDIVNRSLRFATRSGKKDILASATEEVLEVEGNKENAVGNQKWTPAKVGRVSQKRGRKSRRNVKSKNKDNETTMCTEAELDTIKRGENQIHELINVDQTNEEQREAIDENTSQMTFNTTTGRVDSVALVGEHDDDKSNNLLQDDIEDAKEMVKKPTEDDICIIFENNISNEEIKTENEDNIKHIKKKDLEESSVGSYLKANQIKISELGLDTLKYEGDDEIEEVKNSISQDEEEMPSLIVCDDDDLEENHENKNKLNETFEASDSIELVKHNENSLKLSSDIDTLDVSDDESNETPKKQPCLTDISKQNKILLSTPKAKLPLTPKPLTTPKMQTSKQLVKPYRFPTPYRNAKNFRFSENKVESNDTLITEKTSNTSMLSLTSLPVKEIVLSGIRKRSLSVCIDGTKFSEKFSKKVKQDRTVRFYSPANQTANIDDLDVLISKSIKKHKPQQSCALNCNVTTRRKRSMSLDDSIMSTSHISKLPRPVLSQNVVADRNPTTTSTSKQLKRTKLPNFAAIHQKNFNRMENLVDHINRKQERSKNLINSATKLKPVSAQKNVSINKNTSLMEKSKAIKKIDLGMAKINKTLNASLLKATKSVNKTEEISNAEKINKLPDPRMGLSISVKAGVITQRQNKQPQTDKFLKKSQIPNAEKARTASKTMTKSSVVEQKPSFNLSTNLNNTNQDKTSSRLQRHMDLFKSRDASGSTRKKDILRGVRSNRRFELQMQHRKNMEQ